MNIKKILLLLITLVIAGCGGGGGGSSPPPAPFVLISTSPSSGAAMVARNSTISATFSAAIDTRSINANTVQLIGPEGNVISSALSSSGSMITVTPVGTALAGGTQYTMKLGSTITDSTGRTLGAPASITFTTSAQAWSPVSNVSAVKHYFGGMAPLVAADAAGSTMVLWHDQSGSSDALYSRRLTAGSSTWTDTAMVSSPDPSLSGPNGESIVLASNGDAYAGWVSFVTGQSSAVFRFSHYNATTNIWGSAETVSVLPAGGTVENVRLVTGANGKIVSIATGYGIAGGNGIFSSTFDPATHTWSPTQRIITFNPNDYVMGPIAKSDSNGNVVMTWSQQYQQYAAYFNATDGQWYQSQVIEPEALAFNAPTMDGIAIDGNGVATITWGYTNAYRTDAVTIYHEAQVVRFNPATNKWSNVASVLQEAGQGHYVGGPVAVADAAGNTTVILEVDGELAYARISSNGTSWNPPQVFTPASLKGTLSGGYSAVVDVTGNVTIVFSSQLMTAMQYSATTKQWQAPVTMGMPSSGTSVYFNRPIVTVDGSGAVTAAWYAWNSTGLGQDQFVVSQARLM